MTSVQTELGSTRLCAESNTPSSSSDTPHEASSPTPLPELMTVLGGRFVADVVDILQNTPEKEVATRHREIKHTATIIDPIIHEHQTFALARLRGKNVSGAIDYIERHAPNQRKWLDGEIKRLYPTLRIRKVFSTQFVENVHRIQDFAELVPNGIFVDAEAGRIAYLLGQFGVYRAWVLGHASDDGDGWVERQQLEDLWQVTEIAKSKRQARRIIQKGCECGYWTQDKRRKRIYLRGQVKVTAKLVEEALDAGYHHLIETNKPGKCRVQVNLSGSLQEAVAHLYAAWFVAKDRHGKGITISRNLLCDLWQVSIPTLLKWEELASIGKQANFAQSNDTSLDNVPAHAYLTLNRDGTTSAAWRLPNTYFVANGSISQHDRLGKADKIKQIVRAEIAFAERRGSIGDAALLRSGKRYFTQYDSSNKDAFKACSDFMRKLGRSRSGDIFETRYFYIGSRHGVRIYEPYNILTNTQEINIYQRQVRGEHLDSTFILAKYNYAKIVGEHYQYMELFT